MFYLKNSKKKTSFFYRVGFFFFILLQLQNRKKRKETGERGREGDREEGEKEIGLISTRVI